jgi:hypothetical protein
MDSLRNPKEDWSGHANCYKGNLVTLLVFYYTLRYCSLIQNLHQNYIGRIRVM